MARPSCACHNEPMHKNGVYNGTQVWRCAVESRASVAASRERRRKSLPPLLLSMPDSHERAWAAGFIDGEGHIRGDFRRDSEGRANRAFRLEVSQKNPALLDKLCVTFSVGAVSKKAEGHFCWTCSGREAFAVVSLVWPWLGEQKKADFKRAMRTMLNARSALRWSMRRRPVIYVEARLNGEV